MFKESTRIHRYGAGVAPACSSLILIVCVCLFYFATPTYAAITWSGDVQPDDPATWTSSTIAYVGNTGSGTLNITGGSGVLDKYGYIGTESGSTGEVTVDGAGSTWTHGSWSNVGLKGSGTLNVTNGGAVVSNDNSFIGGYSGSTGVVTVDGAGSTWMNSSSLYVGNSGSGTLNVTGGGTVSDSSGYIGSSSGSTGEVTVDGTDSTWTSSASLIIGFLGNGTLNITGGGKISNRYSTIGFSSDSTGEVTVDGAGSTWTTSDYCLHVGKSGKGTLNITNGGMVNNINGYIGYNSDSTGEVTVDGADSTWTNSTDLYVGGEYYGGSGSGKLNIINGGVVSNRIGFLGYKSGSTGVIDVDGAGSTWMNSSSLYVGNSGSGTLNITGGGVVSNEYDGFLGYKSGSTGEVTVDGTGSTWTNDWTLFVGLSGSGTLNITGGGVVSNEYNGYIGDESGSTGEVTVDGTGSTWANNWSLKVGYLGSGMLNITGGGLVSVARILTIDYYANGNSYINMASSGMLALYGDADDSLTDFLGLINGTDAIRYWDDSISDWIDITGATYDRDYTLTYLTEGDLAGYTVLTVYVPESPDPDINQDGDIDLQDFAALASYWLELDCDDPDWCDQADIDHSGNVGILDMQILLEYWLCD